MAHHCSLFGRLRARIFMGSGPRGVSGVASDRGHSTFVDLVAVAFNNPATITTQISSLRCNLNPSEYRFSVADNSCIGSAASEISQICANASVGYLRLPRNPYSGSDPSASHGLALNWIFRHYFVNRRQEWIGFLDHDVYAVERVCFGAVLDTVEAYGLRQERGERWYLWPGFSFFRRTLLSNRRVDFLPTPGLDTGGSNWEWLYSKMQSGVRFARSEYLQIGPGVDPQRDLMELIDGSWLHCMNASGWRGIADAKGEAAEHPGGFGALRAVVSRARRLPHGRRRAST